ncbi:MAG: hypothetical protein ACYS0G_05630 [Planctomycetota bacterium]|jgi:hypothetical protein
MSDLSPEAWVAIAGVVGLTILLCLATLATVMGYERGVRKLIEDVRALRGETNGPSRAKRGPPFVGRRAPKTAPSGGGAEPGREQRAEAA